ncbi:unnamed protein product [Effrenium voratum]|uniref:peptidylprolyl isomerase n=1 Tax=Effrenium voratum TaxID=2562239 RepID=A0AA36MPE1_9DINO|nr:unnamed protein product [Effrenium voratum]CAJ1374492.1 unnamed protein product [Effrenium voratum]
MARQFWAVHLQRDVVASVEVPEGKTLHLSRACPTSSSGPIRLFVSRVARSSGEVPAQFAFTLSTGGTTLGLLLTGCWQLQVVRGPSNVDVMGYFAQGGRSKRRRAPKRRLRPVRLPPGWAALSFRSLGKRLVVTEVPKACFSSAAFGAAVFVGDEIAFINNKRPDVLARLIARPGHTLNTCSQAEPPHDPGSVGKLQSPPCVSCDFVRRLRDLGLDVALQMWLRVVKQQMPITLGVRPKAAAAGPRIECRTVPDTLGTSKDSQPGERGRSRSPRIEAKSSYNPLRPAAVSQQVQHVKAAPKAEGPSTGPVRRLASGLSFQELPAKGAGKGGADGREAEIGKQVEFRFSIATMGGKDKVLERGQVHCTLGKSAVLDGWVSGNVNLEEVLGTWGPALAGMRVGQRRRINVPARLGFREAGPENTDLTFEVELKQVK